MCFLFSALVFVLGVGRPFLRSLRCWLVKEAIETQERLADVVSDDVLGELVRSIACVEEIYGTSHEELPKKAEEKRDEGPESCPR